VRREAEGERAAAETHHSGLACPCTEATPHPSRLAPHGFTLIELLVVMAIIALLLTIAVPRYFHSTDRAREAVLKEDLAQMRNAIDKYYGDRGRYPDTLDDLVEKKYLRRIPVDPISENVQTWITVAPQEGGKGAVADVRSGATGTALDGTPYGDW
jgi:general secretion pathway protein G